MLGAITGDVVGSVYEFHNTKDYNFPLFSPESNYTDDSVMSFAEARWRLPDLAFHSGSPPAIRQYLGGHPLRIRHWTPSVLVINDKDSQRYRMTIKRVLCIVEQQVFEWRIPK